jgi:hypothetical protein
MFDLFPSPWTSIELDDVRAFLADAGEEGVTWEAKADDDAGRLRPDSIRKAACGLANQIGGYLILGARWDKRSKRWDLPGIAAPDDEPRLWLGKVLRRLNPEPRCDPRVWTLDDERIVAVVQVEPVDEAPCMTPQGRVYERVSGETLPVEDPALLDRLFRRGQAARDRAQQFADHAARRALDAPRWRDERSLGVAVALTSIGRETDDITSRLAVPTFRKAIVEALWRLIGNQQPDDIQTWWQQDAFTVFAHYTPKRVFDLQGDASVRRSTWLVQASWDGAVAVSGTFSDLAVEDLSAMNEVVRPGWNECATLIDRLGGYGPARLTVGVHATQPARIAVPGVLLKSPPPKPPPRGTPYAGLPEETWIRRPVRVAEPDEEVLDGIARELQRAAGIESLEPEEPDLSA